MRAPWVSLNALCGQALQRSPTSLPFVVARDRPSTACRLALPACLPATSCRPDTAVVAGPAAPGSRNPLRALPPDLPCRLVAWYPVCASVGDPVWKLRLGFGSAGTCYTACALAACGRWTSLAARRRSGLQGIDFRGEWQCACGECLHSMPPATSCDGHSLCLKVHGAVAHLHSGVLRCSEAALHRDRRADTPDLGPAGAW